jgi:2-amino-4-hydroxy-6-hydroxymethyldihydropteridine diphosphokinase
MIIEPGYYYHIYNRGNNSQKIFYTKENYLFFLKKMKEHVSQFASFVAWCLMPNHFHWIVFVKKEKIEFQNSHTMTQSHSMTSAVQRNKSRSFNYEIGILLRSYARAIQKQENFTGSLFQQHTGIKPLIDEIKIEPAYWNTAFGTQINIAEGKSYLETCIEYIHQNPVYSGLVKNPEDWEYSSYRDFVGLRDGKLVDNDLLKKERLFPVSDSDSMTQSHAITNEMNNYSTDSDSHSMTQSHTMTKKQSTNTVIIGIGSNIDAETNISKMLEILKDHVEIVKVSEMIKTKPIGIANQSDFTNGAVKIKTELNREELTGLLKGIEDKMGRDRTVPKFGPRCIDLDIVVWNGEIVDDDYYTRDFLQKSVSEIS